MMDVNDMSNLTLSELIPDESLNESQLDLVLRALQSKLLKIPSRIEKANSDVDFSCGTNEEIMVDIDDMTTEMYELVMCIRECLPLKEQGE